MSEVVLFSIGSAAVTLGDAFAVVGLLTSVVGGIQQQQAISAQYAYQGAVAQANQQIQNQAALDVLERGKIEATLRQQEVNQLIGIQRSALAANGVVVDEGSALDIVADTAATGAFEVENIRANAERAAYEYRTRGMNFGAQAELAFIQASQTSILPSLATALTSASKIKSNFGLNQIV